MWIASATYNINLRLLEAKMQLKEITLRLEMLPKNYVAGSNGKIISYIHTCIQIYVVCFLSIYLSKNILDLVILRKDLVIIGLDIRQFFLIFMREDVFLFMNTICFCNSENC